MEEALKVSSALGPVGREAELAVAAAAVRGLSEGRASVLVIDPFGVLAAALDLSRQSTDPRRAAIGALLAGQVTGVPAGAGGEIQYRVVEEILELVEASCAESSVLLAVEMALSARARAAGSRRRATSRCLSYWRRRCAPPWSALVTACPDQQPSTALGVRAVAAP